MIGPTENFPTIKVPTRVLSAYAAALLLWLKPAAGSGGGRGGARILQLLYGWRENYLPLGINPTNYGMDWDFPGGLVRRPEMGKVAF